VALGLERRGIAGVGVAVLVGVGVGVGVLVLVGVAFGVLCGVGVGVLDAWCCGEPPPLASRMTPSTARTTSAPSPISSGAPRRRSGPATAPARPFPLAGGAPPRRRVAGPPAAACSRGVGSGTAAAAAAARVLRPIRRVGVVSSAVTVRSSASTSAALEGQRSPGSFASPFSNAASTAGDSAWSREDAGGGGSSTCARAWAAKCSASNGRVPVSSS
jgi:hypothetical protein